MTEHKLKAGYVAPELPIPKVKDVLKYKAISEKRERAVFEIAPKKYVFVYSFGVLVFYDVEDVMVSATIKNLRGLGIQIEKDKLWDEYTVAEHMKNAVEFSQVKLKNVSVETIEIVARMLAQSVALENYENKVDGIVNSFAALNRQLKDHGRLKGGSKELLKIIGTNNTIVETIVSKMALLEEPAAAWESEEVEWLFNRLRRVFELEERFKHIQYKLEFIQNNSEVMLDILNNRKAEILEWVVIILIAIEILIFVYEVWWM
ncbi:MAG TPA: RMD1 family protein [Nanoarchaeota archaeon]|nr:RMD1 family protein [Nanoarchaeota archaeon]